MSRVYNCPSRGSSSTLKPSGPAPDPKPESADSGVPLPSPAVRPTCQYQAARDMKCYAPIAPARGTVRCGAGSNGNGHVVHASTHTHAHKYSSRKHHISAWQHVPVGLDRWYQIRTYIEYDVLLFVLMCFCSGRPAFYHGRSGRRAPNLNLKPMRLAMRWRGRRTRRSIFISLRT